VEQDGKTIKLQNSQIVELYFSFTQNTQNSQLNRAIIIYTAELALLYKKIALFS